jgi:hypothetical protein
VLSSATSLRPAALSLESSCWEGFSYCRRVVGTRFEATTEHAAAIGNGRERSEYTPRIFLGDATGVVLGRFGARSYLFASALQAIFDGVSPSAEACAEFAAEDEDQCCDVKEQQRCHDALSLP